MKKSLIVIVTIIIALNSFAQNSFKLSGVILNKEESAIEGAVVVVKNQPQKGSVTNSQGKFSLSLSEGRHTLLISAFEYKTTERVVDVTNDADIVFYMDMDTLSIDAVIVSSKSANDRISNVQIGVEEIKVEELIKTPALFGEQDIIKSITLLPGIKSDGDGTSGFQVRGGTSTQNLILLDDAPVYNSGHVMGIFSVFNDDALSNAALYKGQIPAQFGGATSSVFDINTRAGNREEWNFGADIGLLSAKVMTEGPIIKDNTSLFASARRSYFDLFLKATEDYKDNIMNFYDVNAKINSTLNENNILSLSFFSCKDNLGTDQLIDMSWKNILSTLNWYHSYNKSLSSNTSLIWSSYDNENAIDVMDNDIRFEGFIKNYGLKHEFSFIPNEKYYLRFGLHTNLNDLKSAEWVSNGIRQKEQRESWENAIWMNNEWKLSEKINLSAGLRFNSFSALGGAPYYELDDNGDIAKTLNYSDNEIVETYFHLEPRLSMNYRINQNQSIKTGYSRNSQNIHAIRNSSMAMPFDRYTMTSNIIKPQIADQVSLGYMAVTNDEKYEFSIEGYYKSVENIYDYKNGKSFNSAIEIESILLGGDGRSYGAEIFAKKNKGRFTGWIGYTISWSENKIDGISNGDWYTASNDRRHDISVVGMYELSKNWQIATTWIYNTGQALTAPSAKYDIDESTVYYYAEKNGYRAPAYHRLDLSFTNTKKLEKITRIWSFGFHNLYNRYNPFMIIFENDTANPTGTKTMKYSLFGILPSISFGIKF